MKKEKQTIEKFAENAIRWAQEQAGSEAYPLRCLAFVEDAYEISNQIEMFGGSSAKESAELYGTAHEGEPPLGAFVFYDTSGPVNGEMMDWGHVGLYIGDGKVIHAWGTVRVDRIEEIEQLRSENGWKTPQYIGWTAPEVFLKDYRAH